MLKEEISKSDISKIKKIISQEINKFKKNDLKDDVKDVISKYKKIEDFNYKIEDEIVDIVKQVLLNYHELFYKDPNIIKNKLKYKK